jgi:hypothetical protein
MLTIPVLGEPRQENCKFEASMDYIVANLSYKILFGKKSNEETEETEVGKGSQQTRAENRVRSLSAVQPVVRILLLSELVGTNGGFEQSKINFVFKRIMWTFE